MSRDCIAKQCSEGQETKAVNGLISASGHSWAVSVKMFIIKVNVPQNELDAHSFKVPIFSSVAIIQLLFLHC